MAKVGNSAEEYFKEMGKVNAFENSMFYWFDKIPKGIKVPATYLLPFPGAEENSWTYMKYLDSGLPKSFIEEVKGIINENFSYPVFIRTDVTSCKHEWTRTCYIEKEDDLSKNIYNLVEGCAMRDLTPLGIAIREFLNLEHCFKAFMGIPIGYEVRSFVRDGKVECIHYYWPEASIENASVEDWDHVIIGIRMMSEAQMESRRHIIRKAAAPFEGYWSIDWAMTTDGEWYLIDMARGDVSWHPEDCKRRKW
jgi:hypothetical protein